MAACALCLASCGDLTATPGGSSTLESIIDTLITNGGTTDTSTPIGDSPDFPDITTPDDGTVQDADTTNNAYCDAVASWPAANVAFEIEVLALVNERRAAGADCGTAGTFGPASPLTPHGDLRCAARNHSLDMANRGFFDHTNPDGDGPSQRLDAAGFDGFTWGENIAWGQRSPQQVVAGWMSSDGHCRNIMNPDFTESGVGYQESNYWTQTFGAR